MIEDFAAFILTHGRPDRVHTLETIRRFGYTGPVYLVVDDEDKTLPEYRERYGDKVLVFSKREIADHFDEMDNFQDRRSVVYARNACWDLARKVGVKNFIQLDDDYAGFYFRFNGAQQYGAWRAECLDDIWGAMLEFLHATPGLLSVCMSQGGDHLGGAHSPVNQAIKPLRKAMNTFICTVDRPFEFLGRFNDDVNTYVAGGFRGGLFLTITSVQVNQKQTQSNAGGLTDIYLEYGTYVKSFYTVMLSPASVKIGEVGSSYSRIHHVIDWPKTAVQIVPESVRKPDPSPPRSRRRGPRARNLSGGVPA